MRKDDLVAMTMYEGTGSISGLVTSGHELLNRHLLAEAEDVFQQALEQSASISASSGEHRHLLAALQGLSEVYVKRGRRARLNDLEHHRMYIHALTAKRRAIECCAEAIQFPYDNQEIEWFREQKHKVVSQLKTLEDNIVKTLKSKVSNQTPVHQKKNDKLFLSDEDKVDICWLESLQEYYLQKRASYFMNRYESREDLSQIGDEVDEEPETEPPVQEPKPIDFEKLQTAIQKIVKKIAKMGTLKIHKDMTPDQKLNLISPLHGDLDIFKTFSRALHGEDLSDGDSSSELSQILEEIEPDAKDTMEIIESSRVATPDDTRSPPPVEDTMPDLPADDDFPKSFKYGQRPSIPFMLTPLPFHDIENDAPYLIGRYLDSQSTNENSVFFPAVYRIWRTNQVEIESPTLEPYTLQTYEEISPLTKFVGYTFDSPDEILSISEEKARFPISASSMNLSLAMALCKLAGVFKAEQRYLEAAEVFKHALGILKGTKGRKEDMLEPMGCILQQLGLLKCAQGDFVGGSQLMEECIRLYERCDPDGSGLLVAGAWFELGNAYIGEQWKESSLFHHIMRTVQEALQVEYKTDRMDLSDDMSDSDESSEGESYSISTQEAFVNFDNALSLLRKLPPSGDTYNKLLVEVLTKMGDCSIMLGNYDQATEYYEEAVGLFKSIVGSATLHNNAHVLAMLATANFLLTNYPKAISMYECSNLLQNHLHDIDHTTFSMAFTLTMLGISYRCLGHYHKCVAWCIRAFGIYSQIYKENILHIDSLERWFVTETLYTLGLSYGTLSFHDKALYYLKLARNMLHNVVNQDTKQCVRILKATGDQYVALEENENALQFYNEALDLISSLGMESGTMALQNQLLNRMAGVHVSTKQYSTAADYLEQALGYQKSMESSIKDDMVEILRQLSLTYTMSGDIERAIECCQECIEAYEEMSGQQVMSIADVLARLGTLHHVKACIQDDNEEMLELLDRAETHYREAVMREPLSAACVQYANYLYQQAQYAEALLVMLEVVHSQYAGEAVRLCYSGVEQAVLPENLQPELDDLDQVLLDTQVYARFLALLCYKQLLLVADAWDCLVELTISVTPSRIALNHSILGYAMLEMGLYLEAAQSFAQAARLQHDNSLPYINCWISVGLSLYAQIIAGVCNIVEYMNKDSIYENILAAMPLLPREESQHVTKTSSIRDSGYYDPNLDASEVPGMDMYDKSDTVPEQEEEKWHTLTSIETVDTHPAILQELARRDSSELSENSREKRGVFSDKGYYSSEYLERQGLEEYEEATDRYGHWRSEESVDTLREIPEESSHTSQESGEPEEHHWEIQEEVVETPAAILAMLQQQQQQSTQEQHHMQDTSRFITTSSYSHSSSPPASNKTGMGRDTLLTGSMFDNVIDQIEEMQRTGPSSDTNTLTTYQSENKAVAAPGADFSTADEWVSFAEVEEVETPMAILQVLHNIKETQQSQTLIEPVVKRAPGKTWTETYEERLQKPGLSQSSSSGGGRFSTEVDTAVTSIEYSSEGVEPEEKEYFVEEIEVETPAAILQEIKRRSMDITSTAQQQSGHVSPMQISPESEVSPTRSNTWSSPSNRDSHFWTSQHQRSSDAYRTYAYQERDSRHLTEVDIQDNTPGVEETIWISEETVTTPTAILEAINNNGAHTPSQHSSEDSHYVRRYGSYQSEPAAYPYHHFRTSSLHTRTDIKNGNHLLSSSLAPPHSQYAGEESRGHEATDSSEERWQTAEETVDTPPEILQALLRAQRSH